MEGGVEGQRALEIGLCGRPVTEMRGDHAGVVVDERVLRSVFGGFGNPHARLVPTAVHRRGPGQRVVGEDIVARLQLVLGDCVRIVRVEMMVGVIDREQTVCNVLLVAERTHRMDEVVRLRRAGRIAEGPLRVGLVTERFRIRHDVRRGDGVGEALLPIVLRALDAGQRAQGVGIIRKHRDGFALVAERRVVVAGLERHLTLPEEIPGPLLGG